MSTPNPLLQTLAEVYRTPGEYACVYADLSVDTGDPPQVVAERRRSAADALGRAGAPQADIDAVIDVLARAGDVPSPVTGFVLVQGGGVVLGELLPGTPLAPESTTFGRVPDLSPLLRHALDSFSYLVVVTARGGGTVSLHRVGRAGADEELAQQGRTDTLHKVKRGGDWRNDYFQSHAEEIWRQTQSELATTIDELVRRHRPRLLVVAGDIRARQLLVDELSEEARRIVSVEPSDQEADGSDPDALTAHIEQQVEGIIRADEESVAELVELHEGRGDNLAELTFGGVVHALASAQVETLLIDDGQLGDRELLALDAPPWVASAPEDALNANVIESVPAPLGIVRAALLTDARVYFSRQVGTNRDRDDALTLPNGSPVAALLRWRTGPEVPGADTIT